MSEQKGYWAIVELMGHVRMAGFLTEEEQFGAKMGRLDIPRPGNPEPPPGDTTADEITPGSRWIDGKGQEVTVDDKSRYMIHFHVTDSNAEEACKTEDFIKTYNRGRVLTDEEVAARTKPEFTTTFFGGQSVYRITPCTEEAARAAAKSNQPTPVHPWKLPRLPGPSSDVTLTPARRVDDYDDEEDDEDDESVSRSQDNTPF